MSPKCNKKNEIKFTSVWHTQKSSSIPARTSTSIQKKKKEKNRRMSTTALWPPCHTPFVHTDTHAHKHKYIQWITYKRCCVHPHLTLEDVTHSHTNTKMDTQGQDDPVPFSYFYFTLRGFENSQNALSSWPNHLQHVMVSRIKTHTQTWKFFDVGSRVCILYLQLETI